MFPLYCGSTNFTAYVFEAEADHSDLSTAKGTQTVCYPSPQLSPGAETDDQCTVTGGETLTETPLLLVNVNDVPPYLGIVDWGLFPGGLQYSVECGEVQKVNGGCEVAAGQSIFTCDST